MYKWCVSFSLMYVRQVDHIYAPNTHHSTMSTSSSSQYSPSFSLTFPLQPFFKFYIWEKTCDNYLILSYFLFSNQIIWLFCHWSFCVPWMICMPIPCRVKTCKYFLQVISSLCWLFPLQCRCFSDWCYSVCLVLLLLLMLLRSDPKCLPP